MGKNNINKSKKTWLFGVWPQIFFSGTTQAFKFQGLIQTKNHTLVSRVTNSWINMSYKQPAFIRNPYVILHQNKCITITWRAYDAQRYSICLEVVHA